jgi:hypothetical protein
MGPADPISTKVMSVIPAVKRVEPIRLFIQIPFCQAFKTCIVAGRGVKCPQRNIKPSKIF